MRLVTIIAFGLVLLFGAARADAKPKVAILGIEVTGTIDQVSTGVAHDLTEGLRSRARQGNGPYLLAPSSERELIDEKVLKNCDSEGPLCMSDIGKDIVTDILVYGKLEKTDNGGYIAKLHVLDVAKKKHEKQLDVVIPKVASTDAVRAIAKKAYGDLLGGGSTSAGLGTLVVEANADTGTVFVDDDQKESLVDGKSRLTLSEGRYRIAVESPGLRRKEKVVMITAGEVSTESFELSSRSSGSSGNVWKPVFGVSLAATAILGGISFGTFVSWKFFKVDSISATYADGRLGKDGKPAKVGDGDCVGSGVSADVDDTGGTLADVCSTRQINIVTGIAAGAVGLVTVGAAYMAFFRSPKEGTRSASRSKASHTQFAVTPVFTEHTQGALVQFAW